MKGKVFYQDQRAGTIEQTDNGYMFTYDGDYLKWEGTRPVSQTLPLQELPFHSSTMFPFFDGLIPEGWLLDIAVETWKINPRDRMKLLLTVCRDCIGAVRIVEEKT